MKEATGELNMTVITVVAIAAVGALFTLFVWPNIQSNLALSSACSNVNSRGNYNSEDAALKNATSDGYMSCGNFVCVTHYNGKTYSRNCNDN